MSKLQATVTARTEVDLKPRLLTELKAALVSLNKLQREGKENKKAQAQAKDGIETLFADADEYEALKEGVRVVTPMGEVPLKIIGGKTAPRLNMKKVYALLGKHNVPMKAFEKCYDPGKDKKEYLGVFIPNDDNEEDDNE